MRDNDNNILVAIKCLAYNHEFFIRECLDGFVMQQTNFRFEAIVHDDASTDGTADIIREYAEKYPDVIKPIFETKNQYSKHDGSLGRIMDAAIDATGAKYIAMCEGDDYWTDPLKLQRQVDFLEKHEDYSMCFHAAEIKNETSVKKIITCENVAEREYFANDFFPGWVVPTASVVYRREAVVACPPLVHKEWQLFGDIVLFLQCAQAGRTWGMKERMSVYRMTESGAVRTGQRDALKFEKICRHYEFLMLNFPQLDRKWPNEYIATYYYTKFRKTKLLKGKTRCLMTALFHSPKYVLEKIIKAINF